MQYKIQIQFCCRVSDPYRAPTLPPSFFKVPSGFCTSYHICECRSHISGLFVSPIVHFIYSFALAELYRLDLVGNFKWTSCHFMPSKCSGCVHLCQHILYDAIVFKSSHTSRAHTHFFIHAHTHTEIETMDAHKAKNPSWNFELSKISAAVEPILFLYIREFHVLNYLPLSCSIPMQGTKKIERKKNCGKKWIERHDDGASAAFHEMTIWTLFRNSYCTWLLEDILCSIGHI